MPTPSSLADVANPPAHCDLVVIGGGILGLAVARELLDRRPDATLCVLEREDRLAAHQTSHSSGVIHAGIYYEPGSLKARLCVEGARLLYAYCEERGIEARKDGKLIVAADQGELGRLDELQRRGEANRVPGLRRVESNEIAEIEPHARGVAALHSPETGIVDFGRVAAAYAEDVEAAGGVITTGAGVRGLRPRGVSISVLHERGMTEAGFAISCAGAWSDRLAVAAGAPAEPRIVPFRGGYLRLRPERRELVRASIYPVPDPDLPFLGGHLTRTIDGEVLLGPSALMVGARDAYRIARLRGGTWSPSSPGPAPGAWPAASGAPASPRSGTRPASAVSSRRCAASSPSSASPTCCRDRPGSEPRRSIATVAWSTTSSCIGPSAPCMSATRPLRPRPRRWRWRS